MDLDFGQLGKMNNEIKRAKWSCHKFLKLAKSIRDGLLQKRFDGNEYVYNIVERVSVGKSGTKEIVYEKSLDFARCSCKEMEFRGIPCQHKLAFLR